MFEVKQVITNRDMDVALQRAHYTGRTTEECYLDAMELLVKAQAGYLNSHTEEAFLKQLCMMKKDRTPNAKGRLFLVRMLYASSNKRCNAFNLIKAYRGYNE